MVMIWKPECLYSCYFHRYLNVYAIPSVGPLNIFILIVLFIRVVLAFHSFRQYSNRVGGFESCQLAIVDVWTADFSFCDISAQTPSASLALSLPVLLRGEEVVGVHLSTIPRLSPTGSFPFHCFSDKVIHSGPHRLAFCWFIASSWGKPQGKALRDGFLHEALDEMPTPATKKRDTMQSSGKWGGKGHTRRSRCLGFFW